MKSLSFVIPVYNSQNTISTVVSEIEIAVQNLNNTYDYEIVLVNDYSRDNTLEVCKKLCKERSCIKLISFAKNFGQHHALMAGLKETRGDYIIFLDDDLQNPPGEIRKLIDTLEQGYDVVFGQYETKKHSALRNIGTKLNNIMANILISKPKNVVMTSFVIVKKYVIDEIRKYDNPYPHLTGLIFRVTSNIGCVFVEHQERHFGKTNYSFRKLLSLWLNGFTNFSVKPLRALGMIGFLFSITAFLTMFIFMVRRILQPDIPMGWTSIMVLIMFFGGIQLISLGLVGEYVGRIFLTINKTPQYVVKEYYRKQID